MVQRRPHILRAADNPRKMLENIKHLITSECYESILGEIRKNVVDLFKLGADHYGFAKTVGRNNWRQRISRLYYGIYNVRRSVQLDYSGIYRTDTSDHQEVGDLPNGFPNTQTYSRRLVDLREDRNLADYDHSAELTDLILTPSEATELAKGFIDDSRSFLSNRGVPL